MKISMDVSALQDALSVATLALATRPTLSVLEGILIKADDENGIKLIASDSTVTLEVPVDGTVVEPGEGVVRGKLFNDVIRKCPIGQVMVTANNEARFTVKIGMIKSVIAGLNAKEFPERAKVNAEHTLSIPQSMLHDMISKTEYCAAGADEARQVLTGGCIETSHGNVTMTCVDGFRLATIKYPCSPEMDDTQAIVPMRSLGILKKLLNSASDSIVDLRSDTNTMMVSVNGIMLWTSLINGPYINWRTLIPQEHNIDVLVDAFALRNAVDRATLIARMGAGGKLISLHITDDAMDVTSRTSEDEMFEQIDVSKTGADIDISFNISYLIDLTKAMNDDSIHMQFTSGVKPCIAHPQGNADYKWLILPVRTQA